MLRAPKPVSPTRMPSSPNARSFIPRCFPRTDAAAFSDFRTLESLSQCRGGTRATEPNPVMARRALCRIWTL
jgi:hypothetical protein